MDRVENKSYQKGINGKNEVVCFIDFISYCHQWTFLNIIFSGSVIMASLATSFVTSILITLIVCDLCLAWSIASDENWWDLKNDKLNTMLNSGIPSEGLHKKLPFYQGFKKRIEQLREKYEDDIDGMIEKTLIKYSIECFLHNSRACLKADWLRDQRKRTARLLLFNEIVDQNEENKESDTDNYAEEKIRDEVIREIRKKLRENKTNFTKRGPLISVDQSLHAVNKGSLIRTSVADRQESSLSRLDILGRWSPEHLKIGERNLSFLYLNLRSPWRNFNNFWLMRQCQ